MPKRRNRKRKCSEPRCCWHQGSKGRRGEGALGGERPVAQNKRCFEDTVPRTPKKIGVRRIAKAGTSGSSLGRGLARRQHTLTSAAAAAQSLDESRNGGARSYRQAR
jgi:hypothetical protein